jgi:hypothetical protein
MSDHNLAETRDHVDAHLELLTERIRQRNIEDGFPADYEEPIDEVRARAAVLRAENDLAEARAILAASQRQR